MLKQDRPHSFKLVPSMSSSGVVSAACLLQALQAQPQPQTQSTDNQVRCYLDPAKTLLEALIKREEKKRGNGEGDEPPKDQMKYKHETQVLEDSFPRPGFPPVSSKFARRCARPAAFHNPPVTDSNLPAAPGWLIKMDPHEPVLLFTEPLVPEKLAASGKHCTATSRFVNEEQCNHSPHHLVIDLMEEWASI